jgi:hypothetical protein
MFCPNHPSYLLGSINSILQAQDPRTMPDSGFDRLSGPFGIVGLDAKKNQLNFSNRSEIACYLSWWDNEITVNTSDLQAVLTDGFQMYAARQKDDLVSLAC